jgi:hypothetical protein
VTVGDLSLMVAFGFFPWADVWFSINVINDGVGCESEAEGEDSTTSELLSRIFQEDMVSKSGGDHK